MSVTDGGNTRTKRGCGHARGSVSATTTSKASSDKHTHTQAPQKGQDSGGDQSCAVLQKCALWDTDVKLIIKKQKTQRTFRPAPQMARLALGREYEHIRLSLFDLSMVDSKDLRGDPLSHCFLGLPGRNLVAKCSLFLGHL